MTALTQEQVAALKVGDKAYIREEAYGSTSVKRLAVSKVTASGQIVLMFKGGTTIRFSPKGRRIGEGSHTHTALVGESEHRIYREKVERDALLKAFEDDFKQLYGEIRSSLVGGKRGKRTVDDVKHLGGLALRFDEWFDSIKSTLQSDMALDEQKEN